MLKFIFWSLLLANVGLFVYQRGYLDVWIPDGHEPARMTKQFNAELMKPIASSTNAATPSADTDVAATPVLAKPAASVCKEVGNFDSAGARRFETLLLPMALGDKLSHRDIEEVANNIVYIPSQGSKEGADKKAAELRHLGVTDFYIIQDAGELHWGISLGVFKTEDSARALLSALNQKGVHSARLGSHSVAATKVVFQLRNLDSTAIAGLEKITSEFPHIETHSCDANVGLENKTVAHAPKQNYPRDVIH
ncbi:MAG TPA: SPOR domain-containing protein [Burkholderiaceae bacterium]|nr:SPOR domain-containing protein [Burkholderiaceae bacterium]